MSEFFSEAIVIAFYPCFVLFIATALLWETTRLILQAEDRTRIRRSAAALLPLSTLIFMVVATGAQQTMSDWLFTRNWAPQVSLGAVFGLLLMQAGARTARFDRELGPILHTFLLSTVASFILFGFLQGVLGSMHFFMIALVATVCLYLMFSANARLFERAPAPHPSRS